MKRLSFFGYIASSFLLCVSLLYGQVIDRGGLKGIEIGMKRGELLDNWGYPAKRDTKWKKDTWYYVTENTPQPTDGIVVYFERGKVKDWKVVDNIYEEMKIWGKEVGTNP